MSTKTDLRIVRTRKLIKEAFLDLIQTKGYESITIQNIADCALVNRATFYLHYKDKQDLLDTLLNEIFNELADAIKPCSYVQNKMVKIANFQLLIETIFNKIAEHKKFFKVMLFENGVNGFNTKMQDVIKEKFNEEFLTYGLDEEILSIQPELLTTFISSALIGTVSWWLKEDLHYSPNQLAKQTVKLFSIGPLKTAGFQIID
ncbi:TetR/AcrR family transcriptional regulator [uncultured Metabacillus sp.]|nr:TetR/AcrR family transcriptional regulator [uncultured Metabacillus sp.]